MTDDSESPPIVTRDELHRAMAWTIITAYGLAVLTCAVIYFYAV